MFAIKTGIGNPGAAAFAFSAQKTMYGGKHINVGDIIFVFASENEGGSGLVAYGIVTSVESTPMKPGIARQTPHVSIMKPMVVMTRYHEARLRGRKGSSPVLCDEIGYAASGLPAWMTG